MTPFHSNAKIYTFLLLKLFFFFSIEWCTQAYEFCKIHVRCDEMRQYTSGAPTPHGMPHDTQPTSVVPTTNGPPESPMQVPCPDWVNVQMVLSKTRAAFAAE